MSECEELRRKVERLLAAFCECSTPATGRLGECWALSCDECPCSRRNAAMAAGAFVDELIRARIVGKHGESEGSDGR